MSKNTNNNTLPVAWRWSSIENISERIHYGYTASAENRNTGVKLLRITDIQNRNVDWHEVPFCEISAQELAKYELKDGDLVFARTGATVGKSYLIKGKIPKAAFASYLIRIILHSEIDKQFVYYFFQSPSYWQQIGMHALGIGQPNVNATTLSSLTIPLPPLAEQHRIVAKIEELFSDLDAGVASLKQAQAQLKTYRQAVLKYAFDGKLTAAWREQHPNVKDACDYLVIIQRDREVKYKSELEQAKRDKTKNPIKDYDFEFQRDKEISSWAEATLDKLIYIAGRIGWRGLKKEEYTDDGPLFLSVHSLNYGKIVDFREAYHVTDWRYEESPEIKLQENDILLCKDGAGIGKIGIVKNLKERATVNSSLLVIRSREIFLPDFLYYFLNGPELQNVVQSRITGSATPHLFQKDIKRFSLHVPPLDEQHQIVQEIESRLSVCDKLEESIKESLQKAEALRQSILKKAFAGKLVPQDPHDEPAEKLLERIRAENIRLEQNANAKRK